MVEAAALGVLVGVHDEQFVKHHTERSLSGRALCQLLVRRPSRITTFAAREPHPRASSALGGLTDSRSAAGFLQDVEPAVFVDAEHHFLRRKKRAVGEPPRLFSAPRRGLEASPRPRRSASRTWPTPASVLSARAPPRARRNAIPPTAEALRPQAGATQKLSIDMRRMLPWMVGLVGAAETVSPPSATPALAAADATDGGCKHIHPEMIPGMGAFTCDDAAALGYSCAYLGQLGKDCDGCACPLDVPTLSPTAASDAECVDNVDYVGTIPLLGTITLTCGSWRSYLLDCDGNFCCQILHGNFLISSEDQNFPMAPLQEILENCPVTCKRCTACSWTNSCG